MTSLELNNPFAIPNRVSFISGPNNLPFIQITNDSATALISLHGAQLLSYRPHHQVEDMLFVSEKSFYEDNKAIRGGIPVCWPWFGPDPKGLQRPNHGFVRNHLWSVIGAESTDNVTKITLQFTQNHKHETTWKRPFNLNLEFIVADTLTLNLTTYNTGDTAFSITQAFHTYFKVADIEKIRILGLENCLYFDKLDQGKEKIQTGTVNISEETDRIYEDVDSHVVLVDPAAQRTIEIVSQQCKTGVVWNPWQKPMLDLQMEDYRHFVCVETGNVAFDLITIPAGDKVSLSTTFKISPLAQANKMAACKDSQDMPCAC